MKVCYAICTRDGGGERGKMDVLRGFVGVARNGVE